MTHLRAELLAPVPRPQSVQVPIQTSSSLRSIPSCPPNLRGGQQNFQPKIFGASPARAPVIARRSILVAAGVFTFFASFQFLSVLCSSEDLQSQALPPKMKHSFHHPLPPPRKASKSVSCNFSPPCRRLRLHRRESPSSAGRSIRIEHAAKARRSAIIHLYPASRNAAKPALRSSLDLHSSFKTRSPSALSALLTPPLRNFSPISANRPSLRITSSESNTPQRPVDPQLSTFIQFPKPRGNPCHPSS